MERPPLTSSMELRGMIEQPDLNGITVMISDSQNNQSTVQIDESTKSFKIQIRETGSDRVTDGNPFTVNLDNIHPVPTEILCECFKLLIHRIQKMSINDIINETEFKDDSVIRQLALSLVHIVGPDVLRDQLEATDDMKRSDLKGPTMRWVALCNLLHDLGGYESIWSLSDAVKLDKIKTSGSKEEAVEIVKWILYGMSVDELADSEKIRFVKEMGLFVHDQAGSGMSGSLCLAELVEAMPETKGKRSAVDAIFCEIGQYRGGN